MLISAVLAALMFYVIRSAVKVIKRHRKFRSDDVRAALSSRYKHLYSVWKFACGYTGRELSYAEFCSEMEKAGCVENADEFCEKLEGVLFGGREAGEKEMFTDAFGIFLKTTTRNMKLRKKIKYYLIDIMW